MDILIRIWFSAAASRRYGAPPVRFERIDPCADAKCRESASPAFGLAARGASLE
jgi:hypothetical protein